jgi:hypothetical protein
MKKGKALVNGVERDLKGAARKTVAGKTKMNLTE